MKIVVGLGNPGRSYDKTRHNIGFRVVDRIARAHNVSISRRDCNALVAACDDHGESLVLAKPQTFMNRSGLAVKALLREHRCAVGDLIVVYDDLDLPFGRIRVRPGGSAGGHRGIRSITESVGGADYDRIRVGIGRPLGGLDAADYVLARFDESEAAALTEVIDRAASAVLSLVHDGITRAMAQYNRAVVSN